MTYIQMALVSIGILSCAQPATAQKKLVIIGSSTSACYNVSYTDCYVNLITNHYETHSPQDTFVNQLAVGGYSVFKGMPTSFVSPYSNPAFQPDPNYNITAALAQNPSVILVNYPTNGFDVLPIDSIMYCFRTIRDSANKKGVPCFITTTQPRADAPFNNSAVKRKLADLKDSILLEFGAFAIDFYSGMFNPADSNLLPAYNSSDNIHFNASGHMILAQRVEAANVFSASSLPATFLKYNATYYNKSTAITWSTAKEIQVSHYDILRSADGTTFAKIGDVTPNNGSGVYDYQYTDQQPLKGWSYYQVVIVDQDGKKQYTPVFKAFANTSGLAVKKLISQPSQLIIELQSNDAQNAGLELLNSTGMLMLKANRHIDMGSSNLSINTSSLSSGIYYIKLTPVSGQSIIASFIKN